MGYGGTEFKPDARQTEAVIFKITSTFSNVCCADITVVRFFTSYYVSRTGQSHINH